MLDCVLHWLQFNPTASLCFGFKNQVFKWCMWRRQTSLEIPRCENNYIYHFLKETDELLLDFIFRQTGLKKKLNTFINFPEQLDMEPFLEQKLGIYEVCAVRYWNGPHDFSHSPIWNADLFWCILLAFIRVGKGF